MTFMMPLMMLIMNGISVLIVYVGAHHIDEGALQVGDMMAFIQYTMQIIMAFLMISMLSVMLPRASVSAKRITEILETEVSIREPEQPKKPSGIERVRWSFPMFPSGIRERRRKYSMILLSPQRRVRLWRLSEVPEAARVLWST